MRTWRLRWRPGREDLSERRLLKNPQHRNGPSTCSRTCQKDHSASIVSEEEVRRNRVVKVREIQSIPRCTWTICSWERRRVGKTLTILVAKDRSSRALMSTVVLRKTTGEFVSKRVVAFMKELGCEMSVVTLKTDNEPELVAVADDVAKVRASRGAQRTIVENSPAHSSKSDGVIERGVQTIQEW